MNTLQNKGFKTLLTKILPRIGWMLLVVFVLAAVMLSAQPVQAAIPCPAPGGGYAGALNMLHDATMGTIPMTRNNPNGNAGMFRAVSNSACP
jgi:hypothetical protein